MPKGYVKKTTTTKVSKSGRKTSKTTSTKSSSPKKGFSSDEAKLKALKIEADKTTKLARTAGVTSTGMNVTNKITSSNQNYHDLNQKLNDIVNDMDKGYDSREEDEEESEGKYSNEG